MGDDQLPTADEIAGPTPTPTAGGLETADAGATAEITGAAETVGGVDAAGGVAGRRATELPPLRIDGPRGRTDVDGVTDRHTIGELADVLGLPRRSSVVVDGRAVDRRTPLVRAGIVDGSGVGACPERTRCRAERTRRLAADVSGPCADDSSAPVASTAGPATVAVTVTVEAGPDSGAVVVLPPGRHVVGRAAAAAVRLDDALVELHHAVLDVSLHGRQLEVHVVQLAGRVPCRIAAAGGTEPTGATPRLDGGSVLIVGASRLRLGIAEHSQVAVPTAPTAAAGTAAHAAPRTVSPAVATLPAALATLSGDPWRRSLRRRPRHDREWRPPAIRLPAGAPSMPLRSVGGLLAAILSTVGGVTMAVVLGHPMYLVFSAVGFVAAAASWVSGRLGARRRRRHAAAGSARDRQRFVDELAGQRASVAAHRRHTAPSIATALAAATHLTDHVWTRRGADADAFTVALGWGTCSWHPELAAEGADRGRGDELPEETRAVIDSAGTLDDVPVVADLGAGRMTAVVGPHAVAVVRSLLTQLAVLTGPADWKLVVVADDVDEWDWCAWLPHSAAVDRRHPPLVVSADDPRRLSAVLDALVDDERHVVLATDCADVLTSRTSPVRRFLATAPSAAVIAIVGSPAAVPSMCRSVLQVGSQCTGRWWAEATTDGELATVHAAGITTSVATAAARRLAGVHDPEDPTEVLGDVPTSVALSQLFARRGGGDLDDAIAIAARWRATSAHGGDGHPRAALGVAADAIVEVDLVADGPHVLLAGTTGAGKSELLRTFVAALAAECSPDDLAFVLVDYKGGSTFDACAELPHTVGVVTDLDDRLAERALVSLDAELRRRERLLRQLAVDDVAAYRTRRGDGIPLPRLVVVIDEFATMAAELPGFLSSLVGIAQRGRSLGVHLVLATQRPAGVVSDEIRANTNLRIALRLHDRADAIDVVGADTPASFTRALPGRAMLRLGPAETVVFQTAHSSGRHRRLADTGLRLRPTTTRDDGDGGTSGGVSGAEGDGAATELAVLTRSIRTAASLCDVRPPFRPWLPPLPATLPAAAVPAVPAVDGFGALDGFGVGLLDDPAEQRQVALCWERRAGNLALIGAAGSGTSTALRSVVVAAADADCYVLDARGDGRLDVLTAMPRCGAIIGPHEVERRSRLVRLLGDELTARQSDRDAAGRAIVLAVDGLASLLAGLARPADAEERERLLRVLGEGPTSGIHTVATLERPGSVPHSVLATLAQRWLFHLDDPIECAALGVRSSQLPPPVPGRLLVTDRRLEAQLAVLPVPTDLSRSRSTVAPAEDRGPATIATLGDDIDAHSLTATPAAPGFTSLALGIDYVTLWTVDLEIPDGEHVLVVGPARSGRSTALVRLLSAWTAMHLGGTVVVHGPRPGTPVLTWTRPAATPGPVVVAANDVALLDEVVTAAERGPVLVVVDDAERVDDADGRLAALVTGRRPDVLVVAAGRPDALRSMYGHWTAAVRRSRLGVVMSTGSDGDGDLFGEPLPRRTPIAPRRGLAWVIGNGERRLVQIARDRPLSGGAAGDGDGAAQPALGAG